MSPEHKRTLLIAACVVTAALFGLTVASLIDRSPEPSYAGRPLSFWVIALGPPYNPSPPTAVKAIQHIGTNALPFAINWIKHDPSLWRSVVAKFIFKHAKSPRLITFARQILYNDDAKLADATPHLLQLMSEHATPAFPQLLRLANDNSRPQAASRAVACLVEAGTYARPQLLAIVCDPRHPRHLEALKALAARGEVPERGIPILVKELTHPNLDIRQNATNVLLKIAPELITNTPAQQTHP
jgi:hypothetical protein